MADLCWMNIFYSWLHCYSNHSASLVIRGRCATFLHLKLLGQKHAFAFITSSYARIMFVTEALVFAPRIMSEVTAAKAEGVTRVTRPKGWLELHLNLCAKNVTMWVIEHALYALFALQEMCCCKHENYHYKTQTCCRNFSIHNNKSAHKQETSPVITRRAVLIRNFHMLL